MRAAASQGEWVGGGDEDARKWFRFRFRVKVKSPPFVALKTPSFLGRSFPRAEQTESCLNLFRRFDRNLEPQSFPTFIRYLTIYRCSRSNQIDRYHSQGEV
jgi:hypothetical protein